MVTLTAWAGFYLGSMRSGITSIHWGTAGIAHRHHPRFLRRQRHEPGHRTQSGTARMIRTAQRPMASGRLRLWHGMALGMACFLLGALVLAWFTNPITVMLTPLDRVRLCRGLHPAQAIHHAGHLHRRFFPGAMPPLLGWTAARGVIEWPAVALFGHSLRVAVSPTSWPLPGSIVTTTPKPAFACCPVVQPDGWSTACEALIYAVIMIPVSVVPFYLPSRRKVLSGPPPSC